MYKVLKYFTDLQDDNHAYHTGDLFPRDGLKVSEERLVELSTDKNKRGCPLIELVPSGGVEEATLPTPEPEKPKSKGKGKNKNVE